MIEIGSSDDVAMPVGTKPPGYDALRTSSKPALSGEDDRKVKKNRDQKRAGRQEPEVRILHMPR